MAEKPQTDAQASRSLERQLGKLAALVLLVIIAILFQPIAADAPELHQTCKEANGKSWACGRAAKARLTTLIKGNNVNCTARDKDRFGRIVAVCSAEGVPDLGDAMVRQGYAIDLGGEAGNSYHQAEGEAQAGKHGIWRGTFERPSDWRLAHPRAIE